MNARKFSTRANRQSGQALVFVLLGLGIFLLGAIAFAVDLSNLWFRRQMAQTAADAACTAGAMDLLVDATNGTTKQGNFDTGKDANPYDCSTGASPNTNAIPAPCRYAALNGFASSISSTSTSLGNNVSFSWSPVAPNPPGITAPPAAVAPTAFMQVIVNENSPTFFAGLLKGLTQQNVGAKAICGVTQATAPIPILVLDPKNPNAPSNPNALQVQGNPSITIVGGPTRSIQVNSVDTAAVGVGGTGLIDLSQGGPSPGTGSDLGTFGGPTTEPTVPKNFNPGTTGHWLAPASPISDPFAQLCAPGQTTFASGQNCPQIAGNSPPAKPGPGAPQVPVDEKAPAQGGKFSTNPCTAIPCDVGYKDHGCPETTATRGSGKCLLYTPGLYDSTTGFATGISVGPGGGSTGVLALFDPGLYYISGGLSLKSNSTIRPGTGTGDGTGGVVIYFKGTGTITVASDSGSKAKDAFNTVTGPRDPAGNAYPNDATHTNVTYTNGVKCTATSTIPDNLKNGGAGVNIGIDSSGNPTGANILLGPCTGYYGDTLGAADPIGLQRGIVFFQDRSAQSVNPNWGGGGQFLLAGTMYFHSCNASGTGVNCGSAPTFYNNIFTMQGNSGSNTYVLGDIVVDNLALGGTSGITMDLNPNVAFNILKASLYQ